jgi:Na+/H+ antiporter NhaC
VFTALVFPAGVLLGVAPVVMFGAVLAGAVFGDNLAPVSDTTIVSAVTQDADIGGDVGPLGLVQLVSIAAVIVSAIQGRHIIEATSWALSSLPCPASPSDWLPRARCSIFRAPESSALAAALADAPLLGTVVTTVPASDVGVGGSIYTGAVGFCPLIVLVLLIVAAAQVMRAGGAFEALQTWLLETVATSVRRAELTMVLGTAIVSAMITINTAAEIAIAPYVRTLGQRFNINGYRRANILDANTAALGYIFPWGGGVLAGYAVMTKLPSQYEWFTEAMLVNPAAVWPCVFHGWFLVGVFVVAALTGYGLEYVPDRESEEVARVRTFKKCSPAGFRSNRPTFDVGEEFSAFLTAPTARVARCGSATPS